MLSGGARLALVIVALAALPARAPASAGPCPASAQGWSTFQGRLSPGARCGSFLAATDASTIAFAYGLFYLNQPVTPPFELTFTWRRLSPDDRSIEVHLLGAVLLFKDDRFGLWIDDDRWVADGWRALQGYRTHDPTTVTVVQRERQVEVWMGGKLVGRWSHDATAVGGAGRIGFALKGARGARATMLLADVSVRTLGKPR